MQSGFKINADKKEKTGQKLAGLYIVGTPIGNMSDITSRAILTLENADLILCEDSRVTGGLLHKLGIKGNMDILADYNEAEKLSAILEIMRKRSVVLVSDSGMPTISDPGFRVVRAARENNIQVFVIPGPTAFVSALVLSGFPTDRFSFLGFFKSEAALRDDNRIRHTMIYYESPSRIMDTIGVLAKVCPERKVAIVREITKLHEETIIGYPVDLLDIEPPRGEIVLIVDAAPDVKITDNEITEVVKSVIGMSTRDAANVLANRTGISRKDAYERILKNGN